LAQLFQVALLALCLRVITTEAFAGAGPEQLEQSTIPTNRLTILLLGFENRTCSPSLDYWAVTAKNLVADSLREVKAVRLAPGAAFARRQLKLKPGTRLDLAQVLKLGESVSAQRVIRGHFQRWGRKWRLSAQVVNVATGKISKECRATGTDWFQLRDELMEQLFRELDVVPTDAERQRVARRWAASPEALQWLSKAEALPHEGTFHPEFEQMVRLAIQADPLCAEAHTLLAAKRHEDGKMDEAEASARRALRLDDDYGYAHHTLGLILAAQHRNEEAERSLKAAARRNPDNAHVLEALGDLYLANRLHIEALESFREALRLDPFSCSVHSKVAFLYIFRGRMVEALAEIKVAERLSTATNGEGEGMLGYVYSYIHDVPAAIRHHEHVLSVVRKQKRDPKVVQEIEKTIADLKARLVPVEFSVTEPKPYSLASLNAALSQKLNENQLGLVTNPLASTAEMQAWAKAVTKDGTNEFQKGRMLLNSMVFHPHTGAGGGRTAQEVFADWKNPKTSFICMEYACFYVALARSVGLNAYCTLVDEDHSGKTISHACACLFMGGKAVLVDPSYSWFGIPHKKFAAIDDIETTAVWLGQQGNENQLLIACQLAPKLAVVQYNRIMWLMAAGDYDGARKLLQDLQELDSSEEYIASARGQLACHDGKFEQAIEFFEKVNKSSSLGLSRLPSMLGFAYAKEGRFPEAREVFEQALNQDLSSTDRDYARNMLTRINERLSSPASNRIPIQRTALDYYYRANIRISKQDWDSALENYDQAIQLEPAKFQFYVHRAQAYSKKGEFANAIQDFQKGVTLSPGGSKWLPELSSLVDDCLAQNDTHGNNTPSQEEKPDLINAWKKWRLIADLVLAAAKTYDSETLRLTDGLPFEASDVDQKCCARLKNWLVQQHLKSSNPITSGAPSPHSEGTQTNIDIAKIQSLAELGDASAQARLANSFYVGAYGLSKNQAEAYKWATVSASQGNREGAGLVREFELFMDAQDIERAKMSAQDIIENLRQSKKQ
jgi:tetratricopeptide (TPR) repeat protein